MKRLRLPSPRSRVVGPDVKRAAQDFHDALCGHPNCGCTWGGTRWDGCPGTLGKQKGWYCHDIHLGQDCFGNPSLPGRKLMKAAKAFGEKFEAMARYREPSGPRRL
jgi:hypothetical protein